MTTTARAGVDDGLPDPSPRFPADRSGVAVLGCGTIAQTAHLPAYAGYGVGVTGVWSRTPATTATVRERFPFVRRVYAAAEDLLADPDRPTVRACPGEDCGWLFLDTRGRRRWCDMASCGNRAKVRAHAQRHR